MTLRFEVIAVFSVLYTELIPWTAGATCPEYNSACESCVGAPPPTTTDGSVQSCVWSSAGFTNGNKCESTGGPLPFTGGGCLGYQACETCHAGTDERVAGDTYKWKSAGFSSNNKCEPTNAKQPLFPCAAFAHQTTRATGFRRARVKHNVRRRASFVLSSVAVAVFNLNARRLDKLAKHRCRRYSRWRDRRS